jgi:ABC-type sugar transport system ATPase subunit
MNDGRIIQLGSPMEIYGNPASYFVADFFGNPAMNLVEGAIVAGNGRPMFDSDIFSVALPERFAKVSPGRVTLGIRPENVRVNVGGAGIASSISLVEPLGKDTLLYFEAESERPFVAVVEGTQRFKRHQNVGLEFPDENVFLFGVNGERIR